MALAGREPRPHLRTMPDERMPLEDRLVVIGDRVLIEPDEGEHRTEVGLYLPRWAVEKESVQAGRIVAAGALADQGELDRAIALLAPTERAPARVREHHLRSWYVLADLYERTGDLPRTRALFARILRYDPEFADVAARLAALGI